MKKIFVLTLVLIFILLTSSQVAQISAEQFSPFEVDRLIGKKAPEFTVKDLSGKEVSFSSFKGKPILLNFWATWCPYCRRERSLLDSLYEKYKNKNLSIISISIGESPKTVKGFLKNIAAKFLVLLDEHREAAEQYGVYALPTSFLISSDGLIKHKFVGMRDWTNSESERIIGELLKH